MSRDTDVMRAVLSGNVPDREAFEEYYRVFHAERERATELVMSTLHDESGASSYDRLVEVVLRAKPRTVLDIGCGDGSLMERLVERDMQVRVSGIDLSSVEIERARARIPEARVGRLVTGSASALPFDDASFDVVASHMVLMLIPEVTEVIAQARRVLKDGGLFAAAIMRVPDAPNEVTDVLRAIPDWVREAHADFAPVNPGDARVWETQTLTGLLHANGFQDVSAEDFTVSRVVDVEELQPLIEHRYYTGSLPESANAHVRARLAERVGERRLTYSEPMRIVLAR